MANTGILLCLILGSNVSRKNHIRHVEFSVHDIYDTIHDLLTNQIERYVL